MEKKDSAKKLRQLCDQKGGIIRDAKDKNTELCQKILVYGKDKSSDREFLENVYRFVLEKIEREREEGRKICAAVRESADISNFDEVEIQTKAREEQDRKTKLLEDLAKKVLNAVKACPPPGDGTKLVKDAIDFFRAEKNVAKRKEFLAKQNKEDKRAFLAGESKQASDDELDTLVLAELQKFSFLQ
ncbi:unnamed protein product [Amoebophrya sp. A120]|nr:unnamed protein product [Amoebophrya sp. A120]|eukprot:GSA120T00004911001.1